MEIQKMPGPLIFLAAPIGAGAGWLAKKGFQARGKALLSEADDIAKAAESHILSQKNAYGSVKTALQKKMTSLADLIAEAERSFNPELLDITEDRAEQADEFKMESVNAAWKRISTMKFVQKPSVFAFDSKMFDEQRRMHTIGMHYAGKTASSGHPIAAALMAGVIAAKDGVEFRDECVNYRNQVQTQCTTARLSADEALKSVKAEAEQFDRDFAILTPILQLAATPPARPALLKQAREWARMLDVVRRERFSDV